MEHQDFFSSRLFMQLIKKEHAAIALAVLKTESLYTYLPKQAPTLEKLEKQYAFWENRNSPDGTEYWLNWVVLDRVTRQFMGTVQIGIHREKKEGTIAYTIGTAFQGKGYGTEAVQAMIDHCKNHYQVRRFKAWIDTRNASSIRLVQKLGMQQVEMIEKADHFDGEDSDEFVFQLDSPED